MTVREISLCPSIDGLALGVCCFSPFSAPEPDVKRVWHMTPRSNRSQSAAGEEGVDVDGMRTENGCEPSLLTGQNLTDVPHDPKVSLAPSVCLAASSQLPHLFFYSLSIHSNIQCFGFPLKCIPFLSLYNHNLPIP